MNCKNWGGVTLIVVYRLWLFLRLKVYLYMGIRKNKLPQVK
jgi:hypothetical protein